MSSLVVVMPCRHFPFPLADFSCKLWAVTATLLDGRALAADILENLKPQVAELDPRLVIVQVGNNPASTAYVRKKLQACLSVGMRHDLRHLPEDASLTQLMDAVGELKTVPLEYYKLAEVFSG